MADSFEPNLMTTGMGSLPLTGGEAAARFVLDAGLSIPFWPQLPKRHFLEQMIPQFSEGMPCVRAELDNERVVFDAAEKYAHLERFYELFLGGEPGAFGLSTDAAEGYHAFLDVAAGTTWPIVKGQVTGPVTLCNGIFDEQKRPLYSDAELRDAAVKLLTRKAEHQIAGLEQFASQHVLIFVDEPVLAAYGSSAYLGISERDVCEMESEIFQAIAQAGGISGIHICGNSDWGMAIRTGARVINFDAYQYGERIALYPDDVSLLFDGGGCIAWGIVPTTERIAAETADSLAGRFDACVAALVDKGFEPDLVLNRSLLTPSCGAGNLSTDDAGRVFELLREMREMHVGGR